MLSVCVCLSMCPTFVMTHRHFFAFLSVSSQYDSLLVCLCVVTFC